MLIEKAASVRACKNFSYVFKYNSITGDSEMAVKCLQ